MTTFQLPKDASPALRAVAVFWEGVRGGSWRRFNGVLGDALAAACKALHFNREDFSIIASGMRGHYWLGDDHGLGEAFYRIACKAGNDSAAQSFEFWARRPPYFDPETGARIFVGAALRWESLVVTCTSLSPVTVVLCAYTDPPTVYCKKCGRGHVDASPKISRRFTVTRDQLLAARRATREANEVASRTPESCVHFKDCTPPCAMPPAECPSYERAKVVRR